VAHVFFIESKFLFTIIFFRWKQALSALYFGKEVLVNDPVQKLLEDMDGKYLDKKESMCKNSRV
jgi:hypothetical protein